MSAPIPEPVILQGPKNPGIRAAVVGCGGTGCNILAEGELPSVATSIAIGSEPKSMHSLKAERKILSEPKKLEAAANISSKMVRVAGSELEKELTGYLANTDIAFIVGGLGGLSGGWGAVLASRAATVARSTGFCVASVPFSVEGGSRRDRAASQLKALTEVSEMSLIMPNDMILAEAPGLPINKAFRVMNSVLASPVSLFLRSVGRDDMVHIRKHMGGVMTMDSAEWDRENAEFAVIEHLGKSKWLGLGEREPRSALLFVEGRTLYDDLMELGKSFSRAANSAQVLVASAGERKEGLRVTAVVGF